MILKLKYLFLLVVALLFENAGYGQCAGLDADAGPDVFSCDPSMPPQLQGSFSGTPMKYYWTPSSYLSDPNALDPTVNAPAGRYKYTLTVESVSTVNLINNGDFESGNTGFTHEYNYGTPGGTFGPGWLSVGVNPPAYNGGFAPCGDHTTGSGNQLIVDGHTNTGAKVWCQNVNVTAGKTYLFRFYVQSVFPVAPCVLSASAGSFTIGTVQAAGNCDWQEFEGCFTATSGSVEMCIREITGVGYGNDFAIDDIQMFEKCMDKDEVLVEIVDLKAKIQMPNPPRCSSDIFDLNGIGSSAGPNISYEWRSEGGKIISSNGLSAKGQGAGKYFIKVLYKNGNVQCEEEAEIEANPSQDLDGSLDVEGIANCNLDTIILKGQVINGTGNYSYNWIPANKILKGQNEPTAYVVEAGVYKLVIIDKDSGCETEIQTVVVSDTLHPNANLAGDSLINCRNTQARLFSMRFDTSKFTYEWILPDTSIIKNKDTLKTSLPGRYQLKVTDKTNKCATTKDLNLKLDTLAPVIELGPNLTLDCTNPFALVNPGPSSSQDSLLYTWKLPGLTPPITERMLFSKQIDQPGWVLLRLTNLTNGCSYSDSLFVDDVRKLPSVEAGKGDTLTCAKTQITLDGSGSKMDSSTLNWYTNSGKIVSGSQSLFPLVDQPGWYFIRVTDTINHCSALDSVFISLDTAHPNAILGPDLIFTCVDTIKTIDASGSSQGPGISYLWSSNGGIIAAGQGSTRITVRNPAIYTLIVTNNANACTDSAKIEVKPDLGAPVASIQTPDTLSCVKTTVSLKGSVSSATGNPIRYSWKADGNQLINNSSSLNPTVQEAGLYTLFALDSINGCSTSVQVNVLIDTLKPNANAGADQIWNCASTQLDLNGGTSSGAHQITYRWFTSNGILSGNVTQSNARILGPGTYSLQILDQQNGCTAVDSVQVIADLVKPKVQISIPAVLDCRTNSVLLDGSLSSAGPRFTYQWFSANGQLSGNDKSNMVNALKTGDYRLIVIDTSNKCADTSFVHVWENITLPLPDAGNAITLNCAQSDTLISGSIRNPSGNDSILWTSPQGTILSPANQLNIRIGSAGKYYLKITNQTNGCSAIDSVEIMQVNDLKVDAGVSNELTCKIKQLSLNGLVFSGSGKEQISWTTTLGNIVGNTNSLNITVDRPGVYYLKAENKNNGCIGQDSVVITENTNYPTAVDFNVDQPHCPGDQWSLNITGTTGGEKPLSFYIDGQLFTGTNIQGSTSGPHELKTVDRNGCELKNIFTTSTPTGINVQLTPLVKISAGESYAIQPQYSIPDDSIASVEWSPSKYLDCTNCLYPVAQSVGEDVEYFVTVTNKNGCLSSAQIKLVVIKRNIWIPNVFSPNGDGINDYFYPVISEGSSNTIRSLKIYDRWGNQLFHAENSTPNIPALGWTGIVNGDRADPGVYIYVIELEWKNGEVQFFYGDLTLVR